MHLVVFMQRPFVGRSQERDGLDDPEATINQVLEDGDEVKVSKGGKGYPHRKLLLVL